MIRAVEGLEDVFLLFLRDTDTAVRNLDDITMSVLRHGYVDAAAVYIIFDGVFDQVGKRAGKHNAVALCGMVTAGYIDGQVFFRDARL